MTKPLSAEKVWMKALSFFFFIAAVTGLTLILLAFFNKDSKSEISEKEQIELFMYCETHPHLRFAYNRANADGVITDAERDAIMEKIIESMKRGVPAP